MTVYIDCNFVGGQRDLYRSTVPIIIIVPEMLFCCFNNKRRWSVLIRDYNIRQDCWPAQIPLSDTILPTKIISCCLDGKYSGVILFCRYFLPVSSADRADVQTGADLHFHFSLHCGSHWWKLMGPAAKLPKIKTPGPWYVLWVMFGIGLATQSHPHCIRPLQTPLQHSISLSYEDVKMEKSSFTFHIWLGQVYHCYLVIKPGRILILIFPFSSRDLDWNATQLTGCWCL